MTATGRLRLKVCGVVFLALSFVLLSSMFPRGAPALRISTDAKGTLGVVCALLMLYSIKDWEVRPGEVLLRRALLLNPGLVLLFASIGFFCVGRPTWDGVSNLSLLGLISSVLIGIGMMVRYALTRSRTSA